MISCSQGPCLPAGRSRDLSRTYRDAHALQWWGFEWQCSWPWPMEVLLCPLFRCSLNTHWFSGHRPCPCGMRGTSAEGFSPGIIVVRLRKEWITFSPLAQSQREPNADFEKITFRYLKLGPWGVRLHLPFSKPCLCRWRRDRGEAPGWWGKPLSLLCPLAIPCLPASPASHRCSCQRTDSRLCLQLPLEPARRCVCSARGT